MPVNELHVCSNSKRIRSEVFTVEIQECLDFLDLPFPFWPWAQGPGFLFRVSCGLLSRFLTRAGVEIKPCSLFTLHFLDINVFSLLAWGAARDPRFLSFRVFAFAQRALSLEVTQKLEASPVCWTGGCRCYDSGTPHPCAGFSPACCTCEWIFKFHLKSCLPLCNEVPPNGGQRGLFQPRGSQSVVSDQQQQGILELS